MRNLPPSQGFQWLNETLAFLRTDARRFFGLSALFLVLLLVVTIPFEIPMVAAGRSQQPVDATIPLVVMQLILALLSPLLMAGWLHAFREHGAGRQVNAGQLFHAFRVPGMVARLLCLGVVGITGLALTVLAVKLLLNANYYTLVADGGVTLKAMGIGATFEFYLISFVIGMTSWALMLFAIPRVMLDGVAPLTALTESFRAVLDNFLALAVFFFAAIVIAAVFFVLAAVAMTLLTVISVLLGKIGAVIGALVGLVFIVVMLFAMIFLLPAAYYPNFLMWRDVFGDDTSSPPTPPATFEA